MDNQKDNSENLQKLLDITTDLSASLYVDSVLYKINISASSMVSSEASLILLFDAEKLYLYFRSTPREKSSIRKSLVKDDIPWWVAQKGEPVIVNDVASDPRFTGAVDSITGYQTKSVLCVPVILEGKIIGALIYPVFGKIITGNVDGCIISIDPGHVTGPKPGRSNHQDARSGTDI